MVKESNKAIFFDRDGTLIKSLRKNGKPIAIRKIDDFKIISQAKKVCNYLLKKNYLIFIITNQPDVEKKIIRKTFVKKVNLILKNKLNIKKIYTCFCNSNCKYKKPNIGSIIKAKKRFNINLKKSFVVGDRWRDIDLGIKAKCKTILIDKKYDEELNHIPNYKVKRLQDILKLIP